MSPLENGFLLGRLSESVPAHRVQDVVAAHAVEARDDVRGHIVADVPDRQPGAAGVGEKVEAVELGLRWVFGGLVYLGGFPFFAPEGLDCLGVVAVDAVLAGLLRWRLSHRWGDSSNSSRLWRLHLGSSFAGQDEPADIAAAGPASPPAREAGLPKEEAGCRGRQTGGPRGQEQSLCPERQAPGMPD